MLVRSRKCRSGKCWFLLFWKETSFNRWGVSKDSKFSTKSERGLFIVSQTEEKVEKCIEWKRAACQPKFLMTSVQPQNNPRSEEHESTLPEALWFQRNNGCIPPLPLELWYQRYQRAVPWIRRAFSKTANPQADHMSAGLLITPLPPGLIHMPFICQAGPTHTEVLIRFKAKPGL